MCLGHFSVCCHQHTCIVFSNFKSIPSLTYPGPRSAWYAAAACSACSQRSAALDPFRPGRRPRFAGPASTTRTPANVEHQTNKKTSHKLSSQFCKKGHSGAMQLAIAIDPAAALCARGMCVCINFRMECNFERILFLVWMCVKCSVENIIIKVHASNARRVPINLRPLSRSFVSAVRGTAIF